MQWRHVSVRKGGGAQTLVVSALPDKFVTGCITAKLSQTWTDFATSLKHKRQEFGIADLIGSLNVEEKARAKDIHGKKIVERNSSAHVVQKNSQNSHKKKFKQEFKQKNTVPFNNKKENKEKENVASPGIMLRSARRASGSPKKYANMVEADGGTSGYGRNLLHTILSVCHSPDWRVDTGANIHLCADISLFSSYHARRCSSLLMGNGARATVHGVGTVDLNLISGKTVQVKNV